MPTKKELNYIDIPITKALRFGISTLNDAELLAILLGVGSKDMEGLALANNLLADSLTIFNLASKPYQYFMKFKGISKARAMKLCAVFEIASRYDRRKHIISEPAKTIDSDYIYRRFSNQLFGLDKEVFILVVLNRKMKIIYEKTLYIGTESALSLSLKEIFREILLEKGYYFYVVHNHPNDNLIPSVEDEIFTEELLLQSKKLGFHLLDHLIIGQSGYYSSLNKLQK